MGPEHILNYGYTPTCQAALERLAGLLYPPQDGGPVRLFDPCCGDGAALAYLGSALEAQGAAVETYGVEIEPGRAQAASERLDHVLTGDFRRVAMSHRSISLALLNPPYDNVGGEESLEKTIIRRSLPYLVEGGLLALVIPERLLDWVEARLKFRWLALFPTEDPASPHQVVLLGQSAAEKHPLPDSGTSNQATLPAVKKGELLFRYLFLSEEERFEILKAAPLPVLYPDVASGGNRVVHPLRAGHRAAYLAGYGATLQIPQGYLRVAVRREELRKEVDQSTTRIIQAPRMTSYLLSPEGLEELPFEKLRELAGEIDQALAMQSYVEEDGAGWPVVAAWEEEVLSRINLRLPPMQGRRGLLPPQAVRAVGMARALLQGEKAVYGVMEMGWGKSPTSLTVRALLMARRQVGLTVVLCPPHLVKKWGREARRLSPTSLIVLPAGNGEARQAQLAKALKRAEAGLQVILILSREMVKLGPLHKPQLARHFFPGYGRLWVCPHCGAPATTDAEPGWGTTEILRHAGTFRAPAKREEPQAEPPRRLLGRSCPVCEKGYAGPEGNPRRWPLADFLYRAVKRGQVRNLLLIGDEIHEYRNASLQGTAFSRLFRAAKWAVLLTGTLFGGKSSDLYRLLRWTSPELRRQRWNEREFVKRNGYLEAVETRDERRSFGRKVRRSAFQERPGVSPTVYRFLLPRTAFGALRDVAAALPPYQEEKISVPAPDLPVDGAFSQSYGGRLYHEKGPGAFMAWLRAALGYFNIAAVQPSGNGYGEDSHIYSFTARDEDGEFEREEIVLDLPFAESPTPLPKEAELLSIVKAEKAERRKSVLLVEQTIARPLPQRLIEVLGEASLRAVFLDTGRISAGERETWIEKNAPRMDVLITHPRAIETGMDLVMFQTVVVYEAIYGVISLAQAIARVWRLGQARPVRVFSLAYEGNLEPFAWPVIAKKITWAKSVYGDFVPSGLGEAGLDENLDLLSALTEAISQPDGENGAGSRSETLSPNQVLHGSEKVVDLTMAGIERTLVRAATPFQEIVPVHLPGDPVAPQISFEEWLAVQNIDLEHLHQKSRQRQKIKAIGSQQLRLF